MKMYELIKPDVLQKCETIFVKAHTFTWVLMIFF